MKRKVLLILILTLAQLTDAFGIGGGGRGFGGSKGFGGAGKGSGFKPGGAKGTSGSKGFSTGRTKGAVRGAATTRHDGYNLSEIPSNQNYVRYNPMFGGVHNRDLTPLQSSLSAKAGNVNRALDQRYRRGLWAAGALIPSTALFLPWNPYYWMYHSVFDAPGDTRKQQQQNLLTKKNMMLNDRIIEQSVLMEQCLVNAKKLGIHQQYCQDFSYDLRVELTATPENSQGVDYGLSVSRVAEESDADALIAEGTDTYHFGSELKDQALLVLNISLAEVIASLAESTSLRIRVKPSNLRLSPFTADVDLKNLLKTPNRYLTAEITAETQGKFQVQTKVTKILPADMRLTENLTQPLGLTVEDVKNCARYFIKIGVDVKLCLKTLEFSSEPEWTRQDLKSTRVHYGFFGQDKPLPLKDGEIVRVRESVGLAEVISEYYGDFYNSNFETPPLFGLNAPAHFPPAAGCAKELSKLAKEGLECSFAGRRAKVQLKTSTVRVFQREAELLIRTAENENMINAVSDEMFHQLKEFSSPEQVSVLRMFLVARRYYVGLPKDIVQNVKSPAKLEALEEVMREKKSYLLRDELLKPTP